MNKPNILAYYLPQFHEIQENNKWWGDGFTEWVALNNAKPYFKGQEIRRPIAPFYQYELPSKEVMEWQANLAKEHHIDGFFIWDYWFGHGERLLSKPKEFVRDNKVDFPYALIWANHSWFNKGKNILLKEQKYLGEDDYHAYATDCLTHFLTDNYIKVGNSPVFGIFLPSSVPDLHKFMEVFDNIAIQNGFDGIYWVAENTSSMSEVANHFDVVISSSKYFASRKWRHPFFFIKEQLIKRFNLNFLGPIKYDYEKIFSPEIKFEKNESPAIFAGWDTTPRHGIRGTFLKNFNEVSFEKHLDSILQHTKNEKINFLVVKSWNEWAEGNLIEPDSELGYTLLHTLKAKIEEYFIKEANFE
ncbi:glycoside hydrolase family 99-like domain-containing protein [Aeromonas jandaei]|uniref:glycosyltransferase WbsX family protein n=1 Tax=Aeromonas jandaei TaxID=650 RepID=UPI00366EA934